MSESQVVDACIKYLWAKNHYVWRNNTGGFKDATGRFVRFGKKGSADIIGLTKDGTFLSVECKFGKNKPTDDQLEFGEQVTNHGGIYIVAYSVDDLVSNGL